MISSSTAWPPKPVVSDESFLQPSREFRSQIFKVLAAILFFIVSYIALVAIATGLAALCVYGGFALIGFITHFVGIALGLGLAGFGVMVVVFLLKFIFSRSSSDRSNLIEIKRKDYPRLFDFIDRVAGEVGTSKPKKVFLTHDVNAFVFYNSSFWSMFFPVRKNLAVGLGLVNSLNVSEFKAVLAHEFGHFSQNSMRLGSFVYNLNGIIYNLLYKNDGYATALERWANFSNIFAFFASLTVAVVQGIQWLLQKIYELINKHYLKLSREMEYHADAVSASVSGGSHLVSALWRIEFAQTAYDNVFAYYRNWEHEGAQPDNVYAHHEQALRMFAARNGFPVEHGLPVISRTHTRNQNRSRLVIQDQWSSHPSTEDREKHLLSLGVEADSITNRAWELIDDPIKVQGMMTDFIYQGGSRSSKEKQLTAFAFSEKIELELDRNKLPDVYKGYFDDRRIEKLELSGNQNGDWLQEFAELINNEACTLPAKIKRLHEEVSLLEQIVEGAVLVESFEFADRRYEREEAADLLKQLRAELGEAEASLKRFDERVFNFFLHRAAGRGEESLLMQKLDYLLMQEQKCIEDGVRVDQMMQRLMPVLHGQVTLEEAIGILRLIVFDVVDVKQRLQELIVKPNANVVFSQETVSQLKSFLEKEQVYCNDVSVWPDAINQLVFALGCLSSLSHDFRMSVRKEVLEFQLRYV